MIETMYILYGCLGGLLPDIIRLVKGRHEPGLADYWKSFSFWIGLFFAVVLGGLAAYLLKPTGVIEALAIGFSAPEILTRILAKETPAKGTQEPLTFRNWWAI